ncbi:MAG: glycosyltransferase family 4 protein, partial [Gloeomargaritales cyanobacterium]
MREFAGKRVVMLVENNYPQDTRVRNEASFLTSCGYKVFVVCLKNPGQSQTELVNGVRVYRLPRIELFKKVSSMNPGLWERLCLKVKSFLGYMVEYFYFTTACFVTSAYIFVRYGVDVIHAHNPPDTLFLVALPFKLLGKKFVFDHHDLCPELYMSRFGAKESLLAKTLRAFEWCSLKCADVTIATNESYKQVQMQRGKKKPESIFIVRNGPDKLRMNHTPPSPRLRSMNKCILSYVGNINPQEGVDYLLRSLHKLLHVLKRDDFYCVIMGKGDSVPDLRILARELQLESHVELTGFVSEEELQANLSAADICVDPDPSSPLNDVSTWIKIMEYMACEKPIVSFDLKETRFSAQDAALFVPPNDELAFAKATARLKDDPELRLQMGRFGR